MARHAAHPDDLAERSPMTAEHVREDWDALVAAVRAAMDRKLSPRAPEAQALARRWMDLLRRTAAEAPEILHDYDGTAPDESPGGVETALLDYLSAALWAKYLTPDEERRLRADGPGQRQRRRLLAALREEMNRGASAASAAVQQLYRQWESALDELTAGDRELRRKWITAARSDPDLLAGAGVDARLQGYLARAHCASRGWTL
ncbi:MAG TPA: TipAS antibiotic-recognition domain-containing protein [Burkholderiales bacterium]